MATEEQKRKKRMLALSGAGFGTALTAGSIYAEKKGDKALEGLKKAKKFDRLRQRRHKVSTPAEAREKIKDMENDLQARRDAIIKRDGNTTPVEKDELKEFEHKIKTYKSSVSKWERVLDGVEKNKDKYKDGQFYKDFGKKMKPRGIGLMGVGGLLYLINRDKKTKKGKI